MTKKQRVALKVFLMATVIVWGPIYALIYVGRDLYRDITEWVNDRF